MHFPVSRPPVPGCWRSPLGLAVSITSFALFLQVQGSENVPHAPFGQWATLPLPGQMVAGLNYSESEAYHIWAGHSIRDVGWSAHGEKYGIDINQGAVVLEYGINQHWAADFTLGVTTVGWRYFAADGNPRSTTGLMDTAFGVRYSISTEKEGESDWMPDLAFRAGAVIPGTFEQGFPFAPGVRSAAIEPEFILRKHFGWTGFGGYADTLFRWNRTTGNDQFIAAAGFFQSIKSWELSAGYRRLNTVSGEDIVLNADRSIFYPTAVRENQHAIEAGFSYTTPKRQLHWNFYSRTVVDGVNTDGKFWVGGGVSIPFMLLKQ